MVGTSSGIIHVDLGGSLWVLVKIFTIKLSFLVKISFLCGYIGSKVNDGARGESVAGSIFVSLGCVDYLGGSISLVESYHQCGGLVGLSLARSPRRLAPAFIHSPYRLGCCSRLVLSEVQCFFSWPKCPHAKQRPTNLSYLKATTNLSPSELMTRLPRQSGWFKGVLI